MPAQLKVLSLNLLPTEDLGKTPLGKFLQWALTLGRYIVIFTELIVLVAFFSRFYFDRKLSDLHEEIAQKQVIVESASQLEKEARFIQEKLTAAETVLAAEKDQKQTILFLAQITPSDMVYNNLYLTKKTMSITATTPSEVSLAALLGNLKKAKFTDISLDSVEKNKTKGMGIVFTVSAKLPDRPAGGSE